MSQLSGEISGLKPSQKKALERTFRRRVPPREVATIELLRHLLDISEQINRRVGVLIDRRGQVQDVVVGSAERIYLPDLGRARAGAARLRGVRWVQTQFHQAALHKDDLTDLGKLRLDYSLTCAEGPGGDLQLVAAHLVPDENEGTLFDVVEAASLDGLAIEDFTTFVSELEAQLAQHSLRSRRAGGKNRAVLVAVGAEHKRDLQSSLDELHELAATAGVTVVGSVIQQRKQLDPRTLVGEGKLEEIVLQALEADAELLIFDRELSPTQSRSVGDATELKVLDRTQLILDIFAQHARSNDGKVQVELAQLKYNLPRLSEMSTTMSRLTGGIGGRGPGETKLEINRRRARERISQLERQIDKLSMERANRRRLREKNRIPVVAIVGYTNAGKSTLLNAMTKSDVIAENKLFATLDPTSRKLRFPIEREVLLADTVGFIRDLPRDLVNAFRATLEELQEASLLLHVIDASDPESANKREAVDGILRDMELTETQVMVVWNKADQVDQLQLASYLARGEHVVSARDRTGLDKLLVAIERAVFAA